MKYTEFANTQAPKTYVVQPDQVKRDRLRNNIAANIARDRARLVPTADDLAIGFARYCQVQKQADRRYDRARRAAAKAAESKVVPDKPSTLEASSGLQEGGDHLRVYFAVVRVNVRGSAATIRTQVLADGVDQARRLLQHLYGIKNVLSLVRVPD